MYWAQHCLLHRKITSVSQFESLVCKDMFNAFHSTNLSLTRKNKHKNGSLRGCLIS